MTTGPLRFLLVESHSADQLLLTETLRKEFVDSHIEIVAEAEGLTQALEQSTFDVAIISYDLQWTDGLTVFRSMRARFPWCPVILCTRATDQELAAQELREGLDDYVVKEPLHLVRLPAAVRAILARTQQQYVLQESEAQFRTLFEHNQDAILLILLDGRILKANPAACRLFGYTEEELVTIGYNGVLDPLDPRGEAFLEQRRRVGRTLGEMTHRRKDGTTFLAEIASAIFTNQEGAERSVLICRDTTGQNCTKRQLRRYVDRLALLHLIDHAILTKQPLETLTQNVLQQFRLLVPCWRAGVILFNLQTQEATLLAVDSAGPTALPTGVSGPLDTLRLKTMDLEAFRQGHSHEIFDLQEILELPPAFQILQAEGVRTLLSVPLIAGGILFGSLNLSKTKREHFSTEEQDICQEVASQLAVAVQYSRERSARARAETQLREEATVNATLARVGQEMISSLNAPEILQRCCQSTIEILGVDQGFTAVRNPGTSEYVILATVGHTPEVRTLLQGLQLQLPERDFLDLFATLRRKRIVELAAGASQHPIPEALLTQVGAKRALLLALYQGNELIGVQTAEYRTPRQFSPSQKRIAEGIAHLVSLALANAQLLEDLKRANLIKDDFVGMMSHELRTPLNIIMGYTDMLTDGFFGELEEDQINALQRINLSTKGLLALINDVLDLNRLRDRRLPLKIEEVALEQLLSQLRQEVELLNQKPTVHLRWKISASLPIVSTDSFKLKIVLKNLIENAIKFTREGAITIKAQPTNDGVEFQITDTGIGIAEDHFTSIFEPFQQIDSSATRPYSGSGLGLYIVRQLVELLNGTVTVESILGDGSTFRVWVPHQIHQNAQA